ncbi:MAG: hypothetical protein FWF59_00260 [Turicibacter sp.]|nr:hypothetical protein [Turicibacter sp.]
MLGKRPEGLLHRAEGAFDLEVVARDYDDFPGGKAQIVANMVGNTHVRKLLVEAWQSFARGAIGYNSKELNKRQFGNVPQTSAYADKPMKGWEESFTGLREKTSTATRLQPPSQGSWPASCGA